MKQNRDYSIIKHMLHNKKTRVSGMYLEFWTHIIDAGIFLQHLLNKTYHFLYN